MTDVNAALMTLTVDCDALKYMHGMSSGSSQRVSLHFCVAVIYLTEPTFMVIFFRNIRFCVISQM